MNPSAPQNFPPLTLTIMRALCSLSAVYPSYPEYQSKLVSCLDVLFHEFWVNHTEIHKPEILTEILKKVLGEEEKERILGMVGKEGKEVLNKNTKKAIEEGAFGLPWMVCEDGEGRKESFWGVDHLGQVREFLSLGGERRGGWKAVL